MSRSLVADPILLEDLKMVYHLPMEGTYSLSDTYLTNIKSSHSLDADLSEDVVIIETAL
ncbi:unnamed protein product [Hymenolepis diminuta]|uniref:Uncharacterized protein n=1 Tax=Hymenolepis diminuta TaxID=6216 RepID=A0A564YBJ9_HYMDI|nr:unnamed protein product [Hymenolepis diminuta]